MKAKNIAPATTPTEKQIAQCEHDIVNGMKCEVSAACGLSESIVKAIALGVDRNKIAEWLVKGGAANNLVAKNRIHRALDASRTDGKKGTLREQYGIAKGKTRGTAGGEGKAAKQAKQETAKLTESIQPEAVQKDVSKAAVAYAKLASRRYGPSLAAKLLAQAAKLCELEAANEAAKAQREKDVK